MVMCFICGCSQNWPW